MVAKLGNMDDPLPQESFQGVDEDEWVSVRQQKGRMNFSVYNALHKILKWKKKK